MSTTSEELRVKLIGAKTAERELRETRRELERTTGATSAGGSASRKAAEDHHYASRALGGVKNALMYGGGLLGLSAVGYGLADITKGGIKAQEQQALLQQALRQTGQGGSQHMAALHTAIEKTSSAGGFGALQETEGIAQLVRETKSYSAAIKDNREAVTLARGVHESYASALSQVQRIETGQVGRLQKYLGIIQPVKYYVDQLTAAQKKAYPQKVKEAELLDKEATAREASRRVTERYGGALVAYNKSTAGSITNANNAFKEASETLGQKLLPAETAAAKEFTKLITEIEKGEGVWKQVGKDISAVGKDLSAVYHFLEGHKELAKLLGYGAAVGVGSHILKKAPGAGLLTKALTAGGSAEEAGGAGAAASNPAAVAAFAAGAGLLYGSNKAIKAATEALSPGYLKQRSQGEVERALLGVENKRMGGGGRFATAGGHAAGETAEGRAFREGIAHRNTELQAIKVELHVDSLKVAETMLHNPRASRTIAEATNKYVLSRKARE